MGEIYANAARAAGGVIFTAATGVDANAIAQVQAQARRRLLRSFVRRGLLPSDDARSMAQWEHGGGFSVDASVRIEAADRADRERLLRYCARPPFALDRLRQLDGERLSYDNPKSGPGGSGPQILTPLELLDRLAAVVPPPRVHRHRYFGVLAPNSPLRTAVTALALAAATTPPPAANPQPAVKRPLVAPPATPGRGCSPAPTKFSRSCVRSAAPTCASSPSSPTRPQFAISSATSANRPRHPGSHPPAARRYGTCPMPGRAPSTPSPHRSTNSINASLGNPERRPPATRDAGQAHADGHQARSLTLAKHPHLQLPWPRGDP